jgi:hypothetical protein
MHGNLSWSSTLAISVGLFVSCAKADEPPGGSPAAVQMATFVADLTPAQGETVYAGLGNDPQQRDVRASRIAHPILAKGIVLKDAGGACVLCAFDWTGICNDAHDAVRIALADAAGTIPERVAVQSLHQHTAPSADITAQRILDRVPGGLITIGDAYFEKSTEAVAEAARDAMKRLQAVTHIGTGFAPVERLASSRRIPLPDGTIATRYSRGAQDPIARMWPEGKIDGFLRTVAFFSGDRPLASLHYYATHPCVLFGDGLVTYGVPGVARERLQDETGVFQVYFNGCGGDIALGKYNNGDFANIAVFAERLHDAMARSMAGIKPSHAVMPIQWRSEKLRLEPRRAPEFSEPACQKALQDAKATPSDRIKAAMVLAFRQRVAAGHSLDFSCLTMGPIKILNVPGETFVEYQLFAQRAAPAGTFVAVAAYGDCGMWYIGDNQAYTDRGGYEQTWSFVEPSEEVIKDKIERLMQR